MSALSIPVTQHHPPNPCCTSSKQHCLHSHIMYDTGSEDFVYLHQALLHKAFHFSHSPLKQLEATAGKP